MDDSVIWYESSAVLKTLTSFVSAESNDRRFIITYAPAGEDSPSSETCFLDNCWFGVTRIGGKFAQLGNSTGDAVRH